MYRIICASTVPQSLNVFCEGLLKELSKQYEVIALSSPGEALVEIELREGVRTVAIPMERHISIRKDLRSLLRLIRVFRKEKPQMVHSITPKAGLLCMMAAWWTKVPVRVHTFTGLVFPTSKGIKKRVLMLTDRITCYCATHIIPEGEGVKNDLINYGITNKPLRVLGYGNVRGVNMEYYKRTPEVEAKAGVLRNPSMFSFLYVGRIVHDKGIDELIEAFQRLYRIYPQTRLFLVGHFEQELDPLDAVTLEVIRAQRSIVMVGTKLGTDLLAYYAAADCFVLPSYREGFPNSVLEAGAMGLSSIVTDINGSREIIRDGYNGLIVPPHDVNALFSAMKTMVDNPTLLRAMSAVARDHISTYFEQGFVRKCLFDYYESILPPTLY